MLDFRKTPGIPQLIHFAAGYAQDFYLVGGAVRDLLLHKTVKDIDVIIGRGARHLARTLSRKHSWPSFPLHAEREMYRVVPAPDYSIDIAPVQGKSLAEDLQRRDFTINAMALPVRKLATIVERKQLEKNLIDPFNGYEDLQNRTIRIVSNSVFDDDPLRLLRVFRFQTELGFSVDEQTITEVKSKHDLIGKVARERICLEFTRTLHGSKREVLFSMIDTHVMTSLFGYLGWEFWFTNEDKLREIATRMDGFHHIMAALVNVSQSSGQWLRNYFDTRLSGGISRKALFHLLLFVPEDTRRGGQIGQFGRNLTLSNQSIKTLETWWRAHKAVQFLDVSRDFTSKKVRKALLFQFQEYAIPAIMIRMIIMSENRIEDITKTCSLLHLFIQNWTEDQTRIQRLTRQVNGHMIRKATGMPAGKELGKLLRIIHEKIFVQEITSMDQLQEMLPELQKNLKQVEELGFLAKPHPFGERND